MGHGKFFDRDLAEVAIAVVGSTGLKLVDLEVIAHTAVWVVTFAFICVKIVKATRKK